MLDFLEVKRFIGELMVLISVVSFFVKVKSSNNENLYPKNLKPLIKYNCAEWLIFILKIFYYYTRCY